MCIVTPPDDTATKARYLPPEVRRRQILDAAAQLAVEDGLEHTSIAKVAETAGLAKGSIYLHFDSRQELLAALQADMWSRMVEEPQRIVADDARSWTERLDAVVAHWMQFELDHHRLYHAVFHAVATDDDEPWDAARSLLREILDGGAHAGEFDLTEMHTDVVVEFLLHAYVGPCFHHRDIETAITDVQRLFRRTVGADAL